MDMLVEVGPAMQSLLQSEDTDKDGLITVDDTGPKAFELHYCDAADASCTTLIKGTYKLSLLLQELALAKLQQKQLLRLRSSSLSESPIARLLRLIHDSWWDNLTRCADEKGTAKATLDPKSAGHRIYVPAGAPVQKSFYTRLAQDMQLDVQMLPQTFTAEFIMSLNEKPGLLALEIDSNGHALPFIVPGDRFNELYNWDSVFCAQGMLPSHIELAQSIVKHFCFQIRHYGKICNANRSYYLGRAQPPLLTDLALQVYQHTQSKAHLRLAISAAIVEYETYWMAPRRYDAATGLNRYNPIGKGFPPECEASQFDHVLLPYTQKYQMTAPEFIKAYDEGSIVEPELDTFLAHDRAARESGHDTSYRVEGTCADLGTIDLQCLLYRYETDIAHVIKTEFDDCFELAEEYIQLRGKNKLEIETSKSWSDAAEQRGAAIDRYCWNEQGMYFDFNLDTKEQSTYESATCLWPLWCGAASPDQAQLLVEHALPRLEAYGGLASTTKSSRGPIDPVRRPQKQWDYPHGWAPHQILVWEGLRRYGYKLEAERLAYRWLVMIATVFRDYNGTVTEKYDVSKRQAQHKTDAEYGNQGRAFRHVPQEGFGWTNASVVVGVSLLGMDARRALEQCMPWEEFETRRKRLGGSV